MDREAWYAAIHGVTKSWTWLSYWTELNWTLSKPFQFPEHLKKTSLHNQLFYWWENWGREREVPSVTCPASLSQGQNWDANPESQTETCLSRLFNSKGIIKTENPGMLRLQFGSPDNGSMTVWFVPDKYPIVLPALIRPDSGWVPVDRVGFLLQILWAGIPDLWRALLELAIMMLSFSHLRGAYCQIVNLGP